MIGGKNTLTEEELGMAVFLHRLFRNLHLSGKHTAQEPCGFFRHTPIIKDASADKSGIVFIHKVAVDRRVHLFENHLLHLLFRINIPVFVLRSIHIDKDAFLPDVL